MTYYFVMLLFIFCVGIFERFFDKNALPRSLSAFAFLSILLFFSGFRSPGVGADDINYILAFEYISNSDLSHVNIFELSQDVYMEIGFVVILIILTFLFHGSTGLFVAIAIMITIPVVSFLKKYSPYIFLSIALYFSHHFILRDMNQLRAGISAAIGLLVISSLSKEQILKSIFYCLLSASIHFASIVYLIPIILVAFKRADFFIKNLPGIALLIYILNVDILGRLISLLSLYVDRLSVYDGTSYSQDIGIFNMANIKLMIIYLFALQFYKKISGDKIYLVSLLFISLALSWRIFFHENEILASRVSTFFAFSEIILVPLTIRCLKNYIFRVLAIIGVSLSCVLQVYINIYLNIDYLRPYQSVFSNLS